MTDTAGASRDWTWWVIAYAAAIAAIKTTFFAGTGLLDTFVFLALLASLYLASSLRMADWARMAVFVALLLLVVPYIGLRNTFYLDVVTQVGIYAALALGLNVVVGFAGLLDLGFVAFFAVGAYAWAIFGSSQANHFLAIGAAANFFPLPPDLFFLMLMFAIILAATAGVLLGLPVLRLRGDYLAIVTLGFGEMVRVLANNLDKPVNITNGPRGITGIGQPLSSVTELMGSAAVPTFKWQALVYYALVLAVIAVAIYLTRRLDNSRIGRAWIAIREDEIAAQAMGVPLVRMKLVAFATGASFAGIMGALFAAKQTFISPESFDFNQSIGVLAMVVLGGLGSIRGAIIGAAIVTILNLQVLKAFSTWLNGLRAEGVEILGYSLANLPAQFEPSKYERLVFGIILIAMMLYRPQGLVPETRRAHELAREKPDEPDATGNGEDRGQP